MGVFTAIFAGDIVEGIAEAKSQAMTGKSLEESTKGGLPNPLEGLGNGVSGALDLLGRGVDVATEGLGDIVDNTVGKIPILGSVFQLGSDVVRGVGDVGAGLVQDGASLVDSVTGIATGVGSGIFGMEHAESAHEARLSETIVSDNLGEAVSEKGLVGGGFEWAANQLGKIFGGGDETAAVEEPLMTQAEADAYLAQQQRLTQQGWGQTFAEMTPTVDTNAYSALYEGASGGQEIDRGMEL